MMKLLLILFCTFKFISTMEVYPDKVDTESCNNKYIPLIIFTFRQRSRRSPYYIDFDFNATCGYGNNMTIRWKLSEYLSGRYIAIPVQFEYNLCDFLYKDKYLGLMIAKQLPGNWSCPFPAGRSVFRNLVTHLENFPLIPFTYSSLIVRIRADLIIYMGPLTEEVAKIQVYLTIKQKLKKGYI